MSAIVVEQLSKQFPREPRPAVNHVSFEVEDGAFVVLLGPSGCGKTTLLKMINRLYEPSGGRILVGGTGWGDALSADLAALRLTPAGAFDGSFSEDGRFRYESEDRQNGAALALQADGKIVIFGSFTTIRR